jgi:hypothetical protein
MDDVTSGMNIGDNVTTKAKLNEAMGFTEQDFLSTPDGKKWLKPDQELTWEQAKSMQLPIGTTWREAKQRGLIPTSGTNKTSHNDKKNSEEKQKQTA